jgi:hypothetical protein
MKKILTQKLAFNLLKVVLLATVVLPLFQIIIGD